MGDGSPSIKFPMETPQKIKDAVKKQHYYAKVYFHKGETETYYKKMEEVTKDFTEEEKRQVREYKKSQVRRSANHKRWHSRKIR